MTPGLSPEPGPAPAADPSLHRAYKEARPIADRLLNRLLKRAYMSDAEADEFRASAHAHLVERDCEVLRRHTGRASLEAYLAVVLSHLLSDFRNALWGRWRPSAAAKRAGWVAVRLEELLYRDGYPPREAVMRLLVQAPDLREGDLWALVRTLPRRCRVRIVPLEPTDNHTVPRIEPGDDTVERDALEREMLESCVRDGVEALAPQDSVIALMHYVDGASLATVARALRIPQRPLYRRRDAILKCLRRYLEARGVAHERVCALLDVERDR